jgi:hypothetical protein
MCGKDTDIETEAKDLLQKKREITGNDEELLHALATIKKLEGVLPVSGGCEATRRVYIDPILVAAARVVKGTTMEIERNIEAPLANGPVDYLFKFQDRVKRPRYSFQIVSNVRCKLSRRLPLNYSVLST